MQGTEPRTLPHVLREIEGLLVELLKSQAAGHTVLHDPAVRGSSPSPPEGEPEELALEECFKSQAESPILQSQEATTTAPARSTSTFRGSRKSSRTSELPSQGPSFKSARRMMQDFSRQITYALEEEEVDQSKGRFEVHRGWRQVCRAPSEKRKALVTTRSSFHADMGDPGALTKQRMLLKLCSVGWSLCSILFVILDFVLIPLTAFQVSHDLLNGLITTFWALRLVSKASSAWTRPRQLRKIARLVLGLLLVSARLAHALRPANSSHFAWGILLMLQLVRLAALPHLYEASGLAVLVHDTLRKTSREARASWNLAWMGVGSVACLHCLTCAWYVVGSQTDGWAQALAGLPWDAQYRRSMEWAPCQAEWSEFEERLLQCELLTFESFVPGFGQIAAIAHHREHGVAHLARAHAVRLKHCALCAFCFDLHLRGTLACASYGALGASACSSARGQVCAYRTV